MLEKFTSQNPFWQTPYLPKIPDAIPCVQSTAMPLTDVKKHDWQFLFASIDDIASPYAENQDYDFSKTDDEPWQDVIVPSSLTMQGFPIENNVEYYYKRTVSIPADFADKQVFLRFEGVYSNARVWINNKFIKCHVGGFTQWDCDITPFAKLSEITLVIGVADLEGASEGIWNPDKITVSSSSWASYYAHHNVGGILRDITLFSLPKSYVARTYINTTTKNANKTWEISTAMEIHSPADTLEITAVLMDENQMPIKEETHTITSAHLAEPYECDTSFVSDEEKRWTRKNRKAAKNDEKYKKFYIEPSQKSTYSFNTYCAKLTLDNLTPKLWDAEHPNLYTLKIILSSKGEVIHENVHLVGFRQISYGGLHETQKNKLYINGKPIKLRGVCRHDVSHVFGRSTSREEIDLELKCYKKNNVNHVRTSHYPAGDYFLQMCDILGIYVEQENSACFKGANNFNIYNPPGEFLDSFAEMIESGRNHPSIIIWSLANESAFEKTYAFRKEFNYAKVQDITRPVIFSYPHTVHSTPLPYDIYSKHYKKVTDDLGRDDMPMLHDEFAHVSCYNIKRLEKENSCREFWGESMKKGWDNIFNTDGALGCAIWGGIDDLFYLPKGTQEKHQNHSGGQCAGYGQWGSILDGYHREKPEAWLTKKAFTPVLLDEKKSTLSSNHLKLHLTNRFDHALLNEVTMKCLDDKNNVLYDGNIATAILPHESGFVKVDVPETTFAEIHFYFANEHIDSYKLLCGENKNPRIVSSKNHLPLQIKTKEIDKKSQILLMHEKEVFLQGISFDFDNKKDVTSKLSRLKVTSKGASATVSCSNHAVFKVSMELAENKINVSLSPKNLTALFFSSDNLQVTFQLPKTVNSISWNRNAFHSFYPQNHIGRPSGTAYLKRENSDTVPDQYGKKPDWDWENDMADFYLFNETSPQNYVCTNDFKTRRNFIEDFTVHFEDGNALRLESQMEDLNAFVQCKNCDSQITSTLQLGMGNYYHDILWGNYWGERRPMKPWKMTFSLCADTTRRESI